MENLLLTADGTIKLCDFGSATTQVYNPDMDWSANQRGLVEEEVRSVVVLYSEVTDSPDYRTCVII